MKVPRTIPSENDLGSTQGKTKVMGTAGGVAPEAPSIARLEHPDCIYASAACGWFELGNAAEARLELGGISDKNRLHPQVLALVWDICSLEGKWEAAADVARSLEQVCPEWAEGWIRHAFALHELGRTDEAWETLHPVREDFPGNFIIPYNLACYACQLGRMLEAVELLKLAAKIGGKKRVRALAVEDGDLMPLRSEVAKL